MDWQKILEALWVALNGACGQGSIETAIASGSTMTSAESLKTTRLR